MSSATSKQIIFINSLIDQIGYKELNLKKVFLDKIDINNLDKDRASIIIERLLYLVKQRKYPLNKFYSIKEAPTIQDFAQFTYCYASLSLSKSFDLSGPENTDKKDKRKSFVLEKIELLKTPLEKVNPLFREEFINCLNNELKNFNELINSSLIYNGFDDSKSFLTNSLINITGKPHLIFESKNGIKIAVLEKIVRKESFPFQIYENHYFQVLSYATLFEKHLCDYAYVYYWLYENNRKVSFSRPYKLFKIQISKEEIIKLINKLKIFKNFLYSKKISFEIGKLNFDKCFRCKFFSLCNHKSGLIENLNIPYNTPEYYEKYPLYYTMKEDFESMVHSAQEDNKLFDFETKSIIEEQEIDMPEKNINFVSEENWNMLIKNYR